MLRRMYAAWLMDSTTATYLGKWGHRWDERMVLAAKTYDNISHVSAVVAASAGSKKYKPRDPWPLPDALKKLNRKGITDGKQHVFTYEEGVAWFDSQFEEG